MTVEMMKMSDGSLTLPVWSETSFSVNLAEGGNIWLIWLPIVGVVQRGVTVSVLNFNFRSNVQNTKACQVEADSEEGNYVMC